MDLEAMSAVQWHTQGTQPEAVIFDTVELTLNDTDNHFAQILADHLLRVGFDRTEAIRRTMEIIQKEAKTRLFRNTDLPEKEGLASPNFIEQDALLRHMDDIRLDALAKGWPVPVRLQSPSDSFNSLTQRFALCFKLHIRDVAWAERTMLDVMAYGHKKAYAVTLVKSKLRQALAMRLRNVRGLIRDPRDGANAMFLTDYEDLTAVWHKAELDAAHATFVSHNWGIQAARKDRDGFCLDGTDDTWILQYQRDFLRVNNAPYSNKEAKVHYLRMWEAMSSVDPEVAHQANGWALHTKQPSVRMAEAAGRELRRQVSEAAAQQHRENALANADEEPFWQAMMERAEESGDVEKFFNDMAERMEVGIDPTYGTAIRQFCEITGLTEESFLHGLGDTRDEVLCALKEGERGGGRVV